MPSKKNKQEDTSFKTILLILGILIVCYCGGYLIGTRLIPRVQKDTKVVLPDPDKEIQYNSEDEKIVSLMDRLMVGMDCWNIEVFANDKTITPADLSSDKIFEIVALGSYDSKTVKEISLEDFRESIKHYFKEGYSFDPLTVHYDGASCFPYRYHSDEEKFVSFETSCGGTCGPNRSQYKVTGAVEKNSVLKIDVRVLFGSQAEDVKFYSDYQRTNFVTDDYEKIDDYYKNGGEYLFTFEKVDGYYVFSSSEKV